MIRRPRAQRNTIVARCAGTREAGIDIYFRTGYIRACSGIAFGSRGGSMHKLALVVAIFATVAWAQENSAMPNQAGCGPDQARFNVKRESHAHPMGAPESGKALVYVFGDSELDNTSIHIGGLITRVGMDGEWVGAF